MSVLNYVRRLPLCFTCLRALSAYVLFVLTCLTCLRAFASSVSSFFDVPYVPSFFLCAYLQYFLCIHMLIRLTQINEKLSKFIKYFHFYKTHAAGDFRFFETENVNYF